MLTRMKAEKPSESADPLTISLLVVLSLLRITGSEVVDLCIIKQLTVSIFDVGKHIEDAFLLCNKVNATQDDQRVQGGRSSLDIEKHTFQSLLLSPKNKTAPPDPSELGLKLLLTTDHPPETKLSFTEAAREAGEEQRSIKGSLTVRLSAVAAWFVLSQRRTTGTRAAGPSPARPPCCGAKSKSPTGGWM